jgi:hypothetical protein
MSRGRWGTVALALVCGVAVLWSVMAATGTRAPALDFKQAGHWVYNQTAGAVFHIDGGTKQVDARVDLQDADPSSLVTLQGATNGFTVGKHSITVFDKSTLTVDTEIPATIDEEPVGIEVVGGPYLVYRMAGTIVRLGITPVVIQAGGPLADPVRTPDGTLWVQRVDSGALCRVERDSAALICPATAPAGHRGALSVIADRPSFVDATDDALLAIDEDHLASPVRLETDLPEEGKIADTETGGRLAVIDPGRNELLLLDAARTATGPPAASTKVSLGPGRFGPPVAAEDAIAVVNEEKNTLLTYDLTGKRQEEIEIAKPGTRISVVRGEDGRVYIDDGTGERTRVVDRGGTVATVSTGKQDVPTAAPPPPAPPPPPAALPPPARSGPPPAPALPGAPAGVQAQAGDAKVTVSWGAANANGSPITAYHVSWAPIAGGGANGSTTVPGRQLTTVLTGLRNGTTYRVTVAAENGVGRGPSADSPPVTPTSDTPGAPAGVQAQANPDGSVNVTWQPADGQGHAIRNYTVEAVGADGSTIQVAGPPQTSTRVTSGLVLGTSYTFVVTAVNDVGVAGPASSPSAAVRPFGPASAPGGFVASGTNQAVDLRWTAPNLRGGELVHYAVLVNGAASQTVTGTTARVTGLANGTAYRFEVRAVTREQGRTGGPTAQGATATANGTPGTTPTVDVLSASLSGDRQVTVQVRVNDANSGAVTCHISFDGTVKWNGACSGTQNIAVGGLAYSTTYTVSATGTNAYGTGGTGQQASVRTNDPPPSIVVSKGAPVNIGPSDPNPCYDPSCAKVHVSLRNFPGGQHTIRCWSSRTGLNYATYTTSNTESEVCYYGFPNYYTWVTVGSVESNHLRWS